ncbi:hypothetical protein F4677DRAFT_107965 [Hypoxylon crocopeplum]|nr:hypothetical protein F4677DRAFT_107965 [Hypoxylon crocopeplum]
MSFLAVLMVALGAGQLVNAQGFITNCTWQTGFMVDSLLGVYCNNDDWANYSYDWTWLDTNACLTNNGGKLYPHGSGNYWSTCGNCSVHGSNADFFLTCECLNNRGLFGSAAYDLNRVVWNSNGTLGCFDYIGNKTEKGPF